MNHDGATIRGTSRSPIPVDFTESVREEGVGFKLLAMFYQGYVRGV